MRFIASTRQPILEAHPLSDGLAAASDLQVLRQKLGRRNFQRSLSKAASSIILVNFKMCMCTRTHMALC